MSFRAILLGLGFVTAVLLGGCAGDDSAPVTSEPTASSTTAVEATATANGTPALPTGTPGRTATPAASEAELPLEVKVGQLIFAGIPGTQVGAQAQRLVGELHIGNLVLMGENVGSPSQVAELTAALQQLAVRSNGYGALIATDQEGGTVQRLTQGFTRLPDAATVGAAADPDLARRYGDIVGSELASVGVNMPLGPVLDVNDNPANPVIGRRAFGSTVDVVIATGLPFIEGLRGAGVIAVGKHFPGHGNTETDSHFTLPVVKKTLGDLEATELAPFRAAVDAGIDAIMVAHVAYPALDPSGQPASLSPVIVGQLLKRQIGFTGVVVTDDLGMAGVAALMTPEDAALTAVQAGADLVICVSLPCDATKVQARLLRAARSGELSRERLDDAVARVIRLKRQYGVGAGPSGGLAEVGSAAHQALVATILAAAGGSR